MLVASVMKKLLWALRYPSFAPELGPYPVGAVQERVPGSIACQIHYPTTDDNKSKKAFYPYFRPNAVEGVANYSHTSPALLNFLSLRSHPCRMDAAPIADQQFPLVVFSHGLGGCMEMYTQLCQQIASYGYMVVAMEHEDGSGAYAETALGDPIPYKRPDDSPYSRNKVVNFRRAFLEQRVQETTKVLEYIVAKSKSAASDGLVGKENKSNNNIFRAADVSKGVALLGHSFGGASMILSAQQYLSDPSSSVIRPSSLNVLDPWAFSLDDKTLTRGMKKEPESIPVLFILSESWLTNPETARVDQFLQNSKDVVTALYVPNSVHASFSDSVSWLPGVISKKLYLRGANEKRHATIPSVAKACAKHIEHGIINNGEDHNPFKMIDDNLKEYHFANKSLVEDNAKLVPSQ